MVVLGGGRFLMSEVPLYAADGTTPGSQPVRNFVYGGSQPAQALALLLGGLFLRASPPLSLSLTHTLSLYEAHNLFVTLYREARNLLKRSDLPPLLGGLLLRNGLSLSHTHTLYIYIYITRTHTLSLVVKTNLLESGDLAPLLGGLILRNGLVQLPLQLRHLAQHLVQRLLREPRAQRLAHPRDLSLSFREAHNQPCSFPFSCATSPSTWLRGQL